MNYLAGLNIDTANNQTVISPTTVSNVVKLAKQKKETIDNCDQALSEVCHALTHANFIEKCCPSSWQDLKCDEAKDVSKIILKYTYEPGKDYQIMNLQNSDEKVFSFFNASDDDQATELFMSRRKENKLAKYTARGVTFALSSFAAYSIICKLFQ